MSIVEGFVNVSITLIMALLFYYLSKLYKNK